MTKKKTTIYLGAKENEILERYTKMSNAEIIRLSLKLFDYILLNYPEIISDYKTKELLLNNKEEKEHDEF